MQNWRMRDKCSEASPLIASSAVGSDHDPASAFTHLKFGGWKVLRGQRLRARKNQERLQHSYHLRAERAARVVEDFYPCASIAFTCNPGRTSGEPTSLPEPCRD